MQSRIALLATVAALAVTPALAQQSTSPSNQQPAPQAQPSQPSPGQSQTQMKPGETKPGEMKAGETKTGETKAGPTERFVSAQSSDEWMGSDVIGMRVRGGGDENIGSISDLVIDKEGRVKAAVIGVGGFLGIGQKNVAVGFDQLKLQRTVDGTEQAMLSMTKEELEKAPEFKEYEPPKPAASPGGSPGGTKKPGGL